VIVIHAALLVAAHVHPAPAVTGTAPVNPPAPTVAETGEIEGTHGAPAWVTVNVLPATVSVPVRGLVPAFVATA